MPTYEYECGDCRKVQEHSCSFSAKPLSLDCECGGVAESIISSNGNVFVANSDYQFTDKSKTVVNFGKQFGRSVKQQHKHYQDYIADMKSTKKALASSKMKHTGMEWLGTMPGEMVDTIGMHEGDPEAVAKDPVTFLKKTGLYEGD